MKEDPITRIGMSSDRWDCCLVDRQTGEVYIQMQNLFGKLDSRQVDHLIRALEASMQEVYEWDINTAQQPMFPKIPDGSYTMETFADALDKSTVETAFEVDKVVRHGRT